MPSQLCLAQDDNSIISPLKMDINGHLKVAVATNSSKIVDGMDGTTNNKVFADNTVVNAGAILTTTVALNIIEDNVVGYGIRFQKLSNAGNGNQVNNLIVVPSFARENDVAKKFNDFSKSVQQDDLLTGLEADVSICNSYMEVNANFMFLTIYNNGTEPAKIIDSWVIRS